ncbi:MAG: STAS domain-containing protein [Bacteroidaceae bacterium]|nr:STAS domain-containing protein [Bacteroidaceae bacterium]
MTTTIERENGNAIVNFIGRLDTPSAPQVETEVQQLMDGSIKDVVVNCADLSYISSSGLRILITLNKFFMKNGGSLTISKLSPEIKEVFDMTGFTSIFNIVD